MVIYCLTKLTNISFNAKYFSGILAENREFRIKMTIL
ncbi:hypothetical protein B6N60_00330 [Richelia sinica FACHB-800]|uniref:Uncharacterized protein n=1 Tax=Richelia sinica FACHB-800 TaxID=1357546 RepID=A0A975T546_9NOST|nr:hypothetical protein B6N60_00330 [Richelia sinica FACHB-800]